MSLSDRTQWRARALGLMPALVLLVISQWGGTFTGEARFGPRVAGLLGLFLLAALGLPWAEDPLRLAAAAAPRRWLGGALAWTPLIVALLSAQLSAVPRAGRDALMLYPALLMAPAGIARCWSEGRARRWGLRGVVAVLGLISAEALLVWWRHADPRPALPLGHHNLLALWCLGLLPLAMALGRDAGARLGDRLLAVAALTAGSSALIATRSLAAAVGLLAAIGTGLACRWWRAARDASEQVPRAGGRLAALAVATLVLASLAAVQWRRLLAVIAFDDSSLRARAEYALAALRGFADRPLMGWGPGSSAWLLAEHLRPGRGRPAFEVVTDPHSLPLRLMFEQGLAGCLALGVLSSLFMLRRWRAPSADVVTAAAVLGLIGVLVAGLAAGFFQVLALPFVGVVLAGAALSRAGGNGFRARPRTVTLSALVLLVAALGLVPELAGQLLYQRSLGESRGDALRTLVHARRFDPGHPLYLLRHALLLADTDAGLAGAEALSAAELARGIPAFWLAAGVVGSNRAGADRDGGATESPSRPDRFRQRALERACDLEPLDGIAPYLLAVSAPPREAAGGSRSSSELAVDRLARAIAAQPVLGAGVALERRQGLLRRAERRLVEDRRWPEEWRGALSSVLARPAATAGRVPDGASDETLDLTLEMDRREATSLSLFAFRRPAAPATLVRLPVRAAAARAIEVPPLWDLPAAPAPRLGSGCGWSESAAPDLSPSR